jgi:hypothetical protein
MFSWAETLAISSRVVTVSVAVRVRSNVAEVVAGRGKRVELGGFRAEWCRAVAERVKTMAIGSCAAIAGKGCYNSVFVLRVTDGDFYLSTQLDFEAASFPGSR